MWPLVHVSGLCPVLYAPCSRLCAFPLRLWPGCRCLDFTCQMIWFQPPTWPAVDTFLPEMTCHVTSRILEFPALRPWKRLVNPCGRWSVLCRQRLAICSPFLLYAACGAHVTYSDCSRIFFMDAWVDVWTCCSVSQQGQEDAAVMILKRCNDDCLKWRNKRGQT